MSKTLAQVKDMLAENRCRLQETIEGCIVPRGYVVRYWPEIPPEDLDRCLEYLRTYTSVENDGSASSTVDDPVIMGKNIRRGTWTHVSCFIRQDSRAKWNLYQVLRHSSGGTSWTWESAHSDIEDAQSWGFLRWATTIDAPADVPGTVYVASSSLNEEDGTYSGTYVKRTQVARTNTVQTTHGPLGENMYEDRYDGQSALPSLTQCSPRNIYRHNFRKNEFGRWDGVVQRLILQAHEEGPVLTMRDDRELVYTYFYERQDDPISAPTVQKGTSRFQRDPEDDSWSGIVQVRQHRASISWWGDATGETVFHYETWKNGNKGTDWYDIYVYDKYTVGLTTAEAHVQQDPPEVTNAVVIGYDSGHRTDIFPLGRGRLMARRVEEYHA